jgi:hypothetical protein
MPLNAGSFIGPLLPEAAYPSTLIESLCEVRIDHDV